MPSRVKIRRSSTEGSTPTAGQLEIAELAVNLADKVLFSKNAGGSVIELYADRAKRLTTSFAENDIVQAASDGELKATGIKLNDAGTGAKDLLSAEKILSEIASGGGADVDVAIYESNATWTKPTGAKAVFVLCVGGGGGGGAGMLNTGTSSSTMRCGEGGGGGGRSWHWFDAAELPASVAVTVAAGTSEAVGSSSTSVPGDDGEGGNDTIFGDFLRANGGEGGRAGDGSQLDPLAKENGHHLGGASSGIFENESVPDAGYDSWTAGGGGGQGGSMGNTDRSRHGSDGGSVVGFGDPLLGGASGGTEADSGSVGESDNSVLFAGAGGGGGARRNNNAGEAGGGGIGGNWGGGGGGAGSARDWGGASKGGPGGIGGSGGCLVITILG